MLRYLSTLLIAFLPGLVSLTARASERLEVFPATITLDGPAASQRLVVLRADDGGNRQDVTAEARIEPVGES